MMRVIPASIMEKMRRLRTDGASLRALNRRFGIDRARLGVLLADITPRNLSEIRRVMAVSMAQRQESTTVIAQRLRITPRYVRRLVAAARASGQISGHQSPGRCDRALTAQPGDASQVGVPVQPADVIGGPLTQRHQAEVPGQADPGGDVRRGIPLGLVG
jgi:hypothetical protein